MKDPFHMLSDIAARLAPEKRKALAQALCPEPDPIAIIGIGCRFPGGVTNTEEFWTLLSGGVDAIRDLPLDRWNLEASIAQHRASHPKGDGSRWGGFLDRVDQFDAQFFGISPREAISMDPQQRLLLEVAWEALEHAGEAPDRLSGSRTGVFIGISTNDYSHLVRRADAEGLDLYAATGTNSSVASGRLSYCLGLEGPSLSIDTACSSSLVAVHLAIQSLRSGESDLALAGGVNLLLAPDYSVSFSRGGMLAANGRCKTFDASADGYVRGEGCGIVVLRPLQDALDHRDRIIAVLRGSAVNQDGRTSGLTVPNGLSQERLIRRALANSALRPTQVSYVEAHGTGTSIGDPIEMSALAAVLGEDRAKFAPLMVGSVKTNIGHLEAAAGIAGLIKTALALQHEQVPPHLNLTHPSPHIHWNDIPVTVPTCLTAWPAVEATRIAGVSSFGFSGTNAHVLLQQVPAPPDHQSEVERPAQILTLSARDPDALNALAVRYSDHLARHIGDNLADICFTANAGRAHFGHRIAFVARTVPQLRTQLASFSSAQGVPGLARSKPRPASSRPKLAFLISGQGISHTGSAGVLYDTQPLFRNALQECDRIFQKLRHASLTSLLFDAPTNSPHNTSQAQPAIFALEYALCELWRSWGVEPDALLGHSLGEYVAACAAGVMSLADALELVTERGRLMQSLEPGTMLSVFAPPDTVEEVRKTYAGQISIAAENAPEETVIAGPSTLVEALRDEFTRRGIESRELSVSNAFHSPMVEPILNALEQLVSRVPLSPPRIRLVSNVTGQLAQEFEITRPAYWRRHARESVKFAAGVRALRDLGCDLFLEIGPGSGLLSLGRKCLGQGYGTWLPSLRKGHDDWETILETLGQLYVSGIRVDWPGFDRPYPRRKVVVPSYPFQRHRFWIEATTRQPEAGPDQRGSCKTLLGRRLDSPLPEVQFESRVSCTHPHYLSEHKVHGLPVLPASAFIEMILAAASAESGPGPYRADDISFGEALTLTEGEIRTVQTILSRDQAGAISLRILSHSPGEDEGSWRAHCTARLSRESHSAEPVDAIQEILARCPDQWPIDDFYYDLNRRGIEYGSSFRILETLFCGTREAAGQIRIPVQLQTESPYYFHPSVLDAAFQVSAGVFPHENCAFVPVSIKRMLILDQPTDGFLSWVTSCAPDAETTDNVRVDLRLIDTKGKLVAAFDGLEFLRAPDGLLGADNRLNRSLYEIIWKPRTLAHTRLPGTKWPRASHEIAEQVSSKWAQLASLHQLHIQREAGQALSDLSIAYCVEALERLGCKLQQAQQVRAEQLPVSPRFQRLLRRILAILNEHDVLQDSNGSWEVKGVPSDLDSNKLWAALSAQYPACGAELDLLRRSGERLAQVLRGKTEPLDVLFPDGKSAVLEALYEQSPFARIYNEAIAEIVSKLLMELAPGCKLRILEIGAGTGGTTTSIISRIDPGNADYLFTDVSPTFLARAEKKYQGHSCVRYGLLDIERDPAAQGFSGTAFDVVVAADVLHATRDLRASLRHVKSLLAPDGVLILLEGTERLPWVDLVFGLTEGWWRFEDHDLRQDHPLLSAPQWSDLLNGSGFERVVRVPDAEYDSGWQTILAARPKTDARAGDGTVRGARSSTWLIFSDQKLGPCISTRLEALGYSPILIYAGTSLQQTGDRQYVIDPAAPQEYRRVYEDAARIAPVHGILHLWGVDSEPGCAVKTTQLNEAQMLGCGSVLHIVQTVADAEKVPRLWLVTRGAAQDFEDSTGPLSVSQAPILGLGAVIAQEHPALHCVQVDLDPSAQDGDTDSLLAELLSQDGEDRICYRAGQRRVARLSRITGGLQSPADLTSAPPSRLRTVGEPVLSNLRLEPCGRNGPGEGEVEIKVEATGLNFRDLLTALGTYPGESRELGLECSGTISAVGSGVQGLHIGDEVIAVSRSSFSTFAVARAELVAPKPKVVSFEEAATIPVAFITAQYALLHLGRIRAGESVLIHAAAGGVGSAAIQVARRAGAEIYGTAGTERKRAHLIAEGVKHVMDSRSLSFADQVMHLTKGRGVEAVLNCLSGEFIEKSLSVLAPGGHYLEIGRRGTWEPERVAALRPDVTYFRIALDELTLSEPQFIGSILREIVKDVRDGALQPLPHTVFALHDAERAFRHMEQARHIGKIVISQVEHSAKAKSSRFRSDATYLITGGLGGLGIVVSKWMVEHGARHLVLASRSAASNPLRPEVQALRSLGAAVKVIECDVSDEQDVARVMDEIDATMPVLRGIIHAAGVLDDGLLLSQQWNRFKAVMAPKVAGTWNLHLHSESRALDFFVLFSSAAVLLGTPGQANHAAANAFMDAVAHYRQMNGLPGLSIDWGAWAEVGSAVERGVEQAVRRGIGSIRPQEGLAALDYALDQKRAQVLVLPVNWGRFMEQRPARGNALFEDVAFNDQRGVIEKPEPKEASFPMKLAGALPGDRRRLLLAHLQDQARKVLGISHDARLDLRQPLQELGMDSLMSLELRNALAASLYRSLPATLLFNHPSIEALADFLVEDHPAGGPPTESDRGTARPDVLDRVESMSEDEVERLFNNQVKHTEGSTNE